MLLGRKNQYCANEYTTKCNLQIQCNPYKITNGIFHRTRTKTFTIHMETQKTLDSQSIFRKKNGAGGIKLPNFRLYYKPGGSEDKASASKARDLGLIPGLGRSPGEGNSNPLQYSCLENPMDRRA